MSVARLEKLFIMGSLSCPRAGGCIFKFYPRAPARDESATGIAGSILSEGEQAVPDNSFSSSAAGWLPNSPNALPAPFTPACRNSAHDQYLR
jgi:hypothetical protein